MDTPTQNEAATTAPASKRFVFIDALRGIAASGVLLHHMLHTSVMEITLRGILPAWIMDNTYGALGVQVFFVISGFVIAHSLRNMTLQLLPNFMLRRQVRLDPPLWAAMALAILVDLSRRADPLIRHTPLPGFLTVLKNILYVQFFTHTPAILPVSWTLCIEVQFYLAFVAILYVVSRMPSNKQAAARTGLIFLLGIASALFSDGQPGGSPYFLDYWWMFAAGVLAYQSYVRQGSRGTFLSFLAACTGLILLRHRFTQDVSASLVTATVIYAVGARNHLIDWLRGRTFQYLGRISYSLYLVHIPVCLSILRLGYKITGTNERASVVWLVLSGVASFVAAHAFYVIIERPSVRLADRLKRPISMGKSPMAHFVPAPDQMASAASSAESDLNSATA